MGTKNQKEQRSGSERKRKTFCEEKGTEKLIGLSGGGTMNMGCLLIQMGKE